MSITTTIKRDPSGRYLLSAATQAAASNNWVCMVAGDFDGIAPETYPEGNGPCCGLVDAAVLVAIDHEDLVTLGAKVDEITGRAAARENQEYERAKATKELERKLTKAKEDLRLNTTVALPRMAKEAAAAEADKWRPVVEGLEGQLAKCEDSLTRGNQGCCDRDQAIKSLKEAAAAREREAAEVRERLRVAERELAEERARNANPLGDLMGEPGKLTLLAGDRLDILTNTREALAAARLHLADMRELAAQAYGLSLTDTKSKGPARNNRGRSTIARGPGLAGGGGRL